MRSSAADWQWLAVDDVSVLRLVNKISDEAIELSNFNS
jgi:hypothetical protein